MTLVSHLLVLREVATSFAARVLSQLGYGLRYTRAILSEHHRNASTGKTRIVYAKEKRTMTYQELLEAVESYGVPFNRRAKHNTGFDAWAIELFGMEPVGTGSRREYTREHVRLLVAWDLTGALMGGGGGNSKYSDRRREVARLLAENDDGFVIANANDSRHVNKVTQEDLEELATLIFRVPEWKH